MENKYPGMWQSWFVHQCVAVGWYSGWGYNLMGDTEGGRGWLVARKVLQRISVGDWIVVALKGHRVGRIGEVTGKAIGDDEWNPLVPIGPNLPDGEMGRRIFVRWDMTVGPDDREMIVALPEGKRLSANELRLTLSEIRSVSLRKLKAVMSDTSNWVGLWTHFHYEQALSGYIAAYPHRLEDGLLPYPNEKIRERIFRDRSRADIVLLDRDKFPVIVECKQNQPTIGDIEQLRRYLRHLEKETRKSARGILVHGGAKKLRREIRKRANSKPKIEIVQYRLDVDFSASS